MSKIIETEWPCKNCTNDKFWVCILCKILQK